jgi:DNA polymerase (family X)
MVISPRRGGGDREARTYECVLVTDHSSSLGVVHGLDADAIARQAREIERINRNSPCQLLQGIEVDITADGTLGLPNTILSDLDLVVASVHSGFRQERDVITRRIISAMENEHVDIIGHPTGRLLGERPPYEVDLVRVFEVAAATETALEVNASPYRLDLDDIFIKQAKEKGVRIAIGSDAHSAPELAYMRYGVILARRGWCSREDVVNTRGIKDLMRWSL